MNNETYLINILTKNRTKLEKYRMTLFELQKLKHELNSVIGENQKSSKELQKLHISTIESYNTITKNLLSDD
jgi:septal ring factor EnvC (AmiA/AmiB activator)